MMVNTSHDFFVFLSVFVCGWCVGVLFDVFRALRKAHTPSKGMLAFQDAVFCAMAFWLFSYVVEKYAYGELRWFVFAGFFLGVFLYFLTIGKFVFLFLSKVFIAIKTFLLYVAGFLKKIFGFITKPFVNIFKKKEIFAHLKFKGEKTVKKEF